MRSPVTDYLQTLYDRHVGVTDGAVADYIPELASAPPDKFGIAMVTTEGATYEVGDTRDEFTIQSISKPLTFGLAIEELGEDEVRRHIGVEPTGDAFNSITLNPETGTPLNPMVNAGAIAAVGILNKENRRERIINTYRAYAGRPLTIDEQVRAGEAATGDRNRAISHLLKSSGAIPGDPHEAVEDYFAQCSALVDCRDLAMIAATLANGGVNPRTGVRAASDRTVRKVLSVMMSCGMYNHAGQWLYTVGLPAKSGVAGGIIAVLPGQLGIGVFSPRLDEAGNSTRGVLVCEDITRELGLHPIQPGRTPPSPIHSQYRINELRSKRWRSPEQEQMLQRVGKKAGAFELQGDIDFSAAEKATRAVIGADLQRVVIDLRRVAEIDAESAEMITDLHRVMLEDGRRMAFSGAERFQDRLAASCEERLMFVAGIDLALEWCEDELLGDADIAPEPEAIELRDHLLLAGLEPDQFEQVRELLVRRVIPKGEEIFHTGDAADEIYLVTRGRLSGFFQIGDGQRLRMVTIGPGGLLGDLAFVMHGTRNADVTVDAEVECWVLERDQYDDLGSLDPRVQVILLNNLLQTIAAQASTVASAFRTLAN